MPNGRPFASYGTFSFSVRCSSSQAKARLYHKASHARFLFPFALLSPAAAEGQAAGANTRPALAVMIITGKGFQPLPGARDDPRHKGYTRRAVERSRIFKKQKGGRQTTLSSILLSPRCFDEPLSTTHAAEGQRSNQRPNQSLPVFLCMMCTEGHSAISRQRAAMAGSGRVFEVTL